MHFYAGFSRGAVQVAVNVSAVQFRRGKLESLVRDVPRAVRAAWRVPLFRLLPY